MRKTFLFATSILLALFSCQKEAKELKPEVPSSVGPTSFVVSLPETRTTLEKNSVLWSDNDEIQVFGYSEGKEVKSAVFQFTGVNESNQAVFGIKEGQELGEFSNYYAAYPTMSGITVSEKNGVVTMSFPRLNSSPFHLRNQNPDAGQFDPNLSVMTAKYDGSRLVFRHGVGYVKITIPVDGVSKVDINFTNNCLGDKPTYSLETGELSSLENSSKNITASGSFVKGQSYYIAAIPRDGYSIGKTEITYTINGQPYKTSTDHFSGKSVSVGAIFDLGCPPVTMAPVIEVSSPSKLDYDAESGSFTFTVKNPVEGQTVSASLEEGVEWISNLEVNDGIVTFDCEMNDAADAVERSAVITLSYEGAEPVDVTVTQKPAGAAEAEDHVWDFSTNEWQTVLSLMGEAGKDITADWDITIDDLNFKSSKARWNTTYIQVVKSGNSSTDRFFYSAPVAGTVTVYFSNTGGSNGDRFIGVEDSNGVHRGSVATASTTKVSETFNVVAGNVYVYPVTGALRVYQIDFKSN